MAKPQLDSSTSVVFDKAEGLFQELENASTLQAKIDLCLSVVHQLNRFREDYQPESSKEWSKISAQLWELIVWYTDLRDVDNSLRRLQLKQTLKQFQKEFPSLEERKLTTLRTELSSLVLAQE